MESIKKKLDFDSLDNSNKENSDKNDEMQVVKPKSVYIFEDTVLSKINIDKNLVLRVVENANGKFIDIRRFYKDYPTKKGVRFSYATFKKLKDIINC